jgi:hypothetical protein
MRGEPGRALRSSQRRSADDRPWFRNTCGRSLAAKEGPTEASKLTAALVVAIDPCSRGGALRRGLAFTAAMFYAPNPSPSIQLTNGPGGNGGGNGNGGTNGNGGNSALNDNSSTPKTPRTNQSPTVTLNGSTVGNPGNGPKVVPSNGGGPAPDLADLITAPIAVATDVVGALVPQGAGPNAPVAAPLPTLSGPGNNQGFFGIGGPPGQDPLRALIRAIFGPQGFFGIGGPPGQDPLRALIRAVVGPSNNSLLKGWFRAL